MTDGPGGYFTTGLKFPDGKPKPTYAAFRMPLYLPVRATAKGSSAGRLGRRPPGAQRAARQPPRAASCRSSSSPRRAERSRPSATVPITDRYGYFEVPEKFPGSGKVRLAWSYPHGPQVFSRTVVITLR